MDDENAVDDGTASSLAIATIREGASTTGDGMSSVLCKDAVDRVKSETGRLMTENAVTMSVARKKGNHTENEREDRHVAGRKEDLVAAPVNAGKDSQSTKSEVEEAEQLEVKGKKKAVDDVVDPSVENEPFSSHGSSSTRPASRPPPSSSPFQPLGHDYSRSQPTRRELREVMMAGETLENARSRGAAGKLSVPLTATRTKHFEAELDRAIRWNSFLTHNSITAPALLDFIFRDRPSVDLCNYAWAYDMVVRSHRLYKAQVCDRMAMLIDIAATMSPDILTLSDQGFARILEASFDAVNYFYCFEYIKTHVEIAGSSPRGQQYMKAIFVNLGVAVWHWKKNSKEADAWNKVLDSYDMLPLLPVHDDVDITDFQQLEPESNLCVVLEERHHDFSEAEAAFIFPRKLSTNTTELPRASDISRDLQNHPPTLFSVRLCRPETADTPSLWYRWRTAEVPIPLLALLCLMMLADLVTFFGSGWLFLGIWKVFRG